MLPTVYLAAEDEPGLAVGRKLVAAIPPLSVYREENAHGFGRLKGKVSNFQQMGANGLPVLMITDLDRRPCPTEMLDDWLGVSPSQGFLFRICVREIEAWLLADKAAMANFLGISPNFLPVAPESLADPKAELIALAQRSPHRKIRIGFKPVGTATIGPDYNNLLRDFVRDVWNASLAAQNSPSLARARQRLGELAQRVDPNSF